MLAPTLENQIVRLSPLGLNNYTNLIEISKQENLVQYSPTKIDTEKDLRDYVQKAVDGLYRKTTIPFIVYDKRQNLYAGNTHFMNISWKNKVLEIGSTWIGKEFHGTGLNKQMKFLMLRYAFEELHFDKVAFRADERNTPSRKAIEKLGATLEGILRKDTLMLDGFKRSTACYGILSEEWPAIKSKIFDDFE
jgi:RimJ/RimL family protein N-acetyltransferase